MPNKEKDKYLLEIAAPDKVYRREYTMAYSRAQAWQIFKRRAITEGWDYLLVMDSLLVSVSRVADINPEPKPKTQEEEHSSWETCPKCQKELSDDYCPNCGWQRFSRWYGRAKKGAILIPSIGKTSFTRE